MIQHINYKTLIYLTFTFIVFTILGTISHEYGHIIVAKFLGQDTTLHYGHMTHHNPIYNQWIFDTYHENKEAIENGIDFSKKELFEELTNTTNQHSLLIWMGGPLQTMANGTMGFFILLYRRKNNGHSPFKLIDWIATFLSLFWLRQVYNYVISIGHEIVFPNGHFFGGDERYIADSLEIWSGSMATSTALIGFIISSVVIFRLIPKTYVYTFIIAGFIGGIIGYIIWFHALGPFILP